MYELDNIVMFPKIVITGGKSGAVQCKEGKENDKYRVMVTFLGRKAIPEQNGSFFNFSFLAFDEVAEKIKRMKLRKGSRVSIYAQIRPFMKTFEGRLQIPQFSFVVQDIGFVEHEKKCAISTKEETEKVAENVEQSLKKENAVEVSIDDIIGAAFTE